MTNSYQPQARPVNTFVQPSVVAPSSGVDDLLKILQSVNPGLNKFLDNRIDTAIEAEKVEGMNEQIQKVIDDGSFGKLATKVGKEDGEEAAKELIGGSIFKRHAAETTQAKLASLGLKSALETEYTIPFDTGEVDEEGDPIFKSINQFAPDSQEFINWRQERIERALASVANVRPEIIAKEFMPELQSQVFEITTHHSKQHKQFQFEELISETPKVINKGINLILKDENNEELKELFKAHFQDLYKLGVTGQLAKKNNRDTLESYFAKADELIALGTKTNNPLLIKKAELLPQILAENTPYGPGGTDNLTTHPDYIEMNADHIEKFNIKRVQMIEAENRLEELNQTDKIEEKMQKIWKIKVTNEKGEIDPKLVKIQQDEFQKLLDENREFAKEIQVWGISDNDTLIARAAEIQNQMITGFYGDNVKKALTDIQIMFSRHATLDRDAISLRSELENYATNQMPKLGSLLKDNENEIMRPIDNLLGVNVFGEFEKPEKRRQAIRYRRTVRNALANWLKNYKDEDNKPAVPTQDEWRNKRNQYQDKLLVEIGVISQQEFNQQHPNYENDNFKLFVDDPDKINRLVNQGNKDRPNGFEDGAGRVLFESGSLKTQQQGDKPTPTPTNNQTTETETEEEEVLSSILPSEYKKLDESQKELYEPLRDRRGNIKRYVPTEEYDYQGRGIRDYLDDQGLNNIAGFYGRGDARANQKLRTEVQTTPIYDQGILEQQVERLEELAREFPEGISWEELSVGSDFRLRKRSEIDFEAINIILNRTGLTPKEFFESQMNAHEVQIPTGLFDKLFPPPKQNITINEFNKLSNEEKQDYEFQLKKNDKQASSILDKGTLIAGELQPGILDQENNSKQQLEKQMLDIIHSGESTLDTKAGGYEAFNQGGAKEGEEVLGFSGTYGDHPANKGKKLVNMTIQEILDIQDSGYDFEKYPDTAEGQAKWEASGGIHAAGRYQFIRSGLRDAMKLAGIKPQEKFTPEIQDKLAIALLVNRGPDWWVSMKGNKELKELLEKYKKTDWTKSSTIDRRSDIA